MSAQQHSQPLRLRWVKGVNVFRCNLPPALLAESPGPFTCHYGNTGVEPTPNNSQYTKLTPEEKILPLLLPGFELTTFRSRVPRSYQRAIAAPGQSTGRNMKKVLAKALNQTKSRTNQTNIYHVNCSSGLDLPEFGTIIVVIAFLC